MIDSILESYKEITEEIIRNIKNDVDTNNLMEKRESLIKKLFENENIDKNNVKELYLSKGLLDLDKKLKVTIEEEQVKVKEEIKILHKRKSANTVYAKNINTINIFNKKI